MLEKISNRIAAWSMANSVHKWKMEAKKEIIQFRKNHPSKFSEIKILAEKLKEVIAQDGVCDEALELHNQIFDLWSGGFFSDFFVYASVFYDGFYSTKEKLTQEDAARLWTVRAKNIPYMERFETDLRNDYKNLMQKIFRSFDNHPELQISFVKKLFTKEIIFLRVEDEKPQEYESVFIKFLQSIRMIKDTDEDEHENEDNDYIYRPKRIFEHNIGCEEKFYTLRDLCSVLNIKLDFDSIDIAAAKKYEMMYTDPITRIELHVDNDLYEHALNNNRLCSKLAMTAEEKIDECFATSHISDEQIVKVYKIVSKAFLREKFDLDIFGARFSFWKNFFDALPLTVRSEVFGAS